MFFLLECDPLEECLVTITRLINLTGFQSEMYYRGFGRVHLAKAYRRIISGLI